MDLPAIYAENNFNRLKLHNLIYGRVFSMQISLPAP